VGRICAHGVPPILHQCNMLRLRHVMFVDLLSYWCSSEAT
jgi:hypothetical protein